MLILPFISALIYPLGSLWTQQSQKAGAGPWRIALIGNLIIAACFWTLLLGRPEWPEWHLIGWPILAGTCFFCGQFTTVLSLRYGDISMVTPMMGCKTLFVALYSSLSGTESLGYSLWIAAVLTAIAVYLLGRSPQDEGAKSESGGDGKSSAGGKSSFKAIGLAVLSTAFFAGVDTTVGAQGASFGSVWMIVLMMGVLASWSLLITPLALKEPAPAAGGKRAIVKANVAFGVQAILLNLANALLARPTAINIIYSLRGLTGILAVWFVGHRFGNDERKSVPAHVMGARVSGALLLLAAVILVMVQ